MNLQTTKIKHEIRATVVSCSPVARYCTLGSEVSSTRLPNITQEYVDRRKNSEDLLHLQFSDSSIILSYRYFAGFHNTRSLTSCIPFILLINRTKCYQRLFYSRISMTELQNTALPKVRLKVARRIRHVECAEIIEASALTIAPSQVHRRVRQNRNGKHVQGSLLWVDCRWAGQKGEHATFDWLAGSGCRVAFAFPVG